MRVECEIWWDKQNLDNQGWRVVWRFGEGAEREYANDTVDGTRRCGLTTLRRRAWRRVKPSTLVGELRRAFAQARWVRNDTRDGWIATVDA